MADEDQRRKEEALKLKFDQAKHLTTLNTAAAVAVVAIHRDLGLSETLLVVIALAFFLLSGLAALTAMTLVPNKFYENRLAYGWAESLVVYSSVLFAGGLFGFIGAPLSLPVWPMVVLLIISIGLAILVSLTVVH